MWQSGRLFILHSPTVNNERSANNVDLWEIEDVSDPSSGTKVADLWNTQRSATALADHNGRLLIYAVQRHFNSPPYTTFGGEIWEVTGLDPLAVSKVGEPPNQSGAQGAWHPTTTDCMRWSPRGDGSQTNDLYEITSLTPPITTTNLGRMPVGTGSGGMTSHNGRFLVASTSTSRLYEITNLNPLTTSDLGSLPAGLAVETAMASHRGKLLIADWTNPEDLWEVTDLNSVSTSTTELGDLPLALTHPVGMVSYSGSL